ncbi:MAG: serine hydrolase [Gammaproteobacteria bacterium]|nr:serine hydrolase [Gammaproteobacteria bacterium]
MMRTTLLLLSAAPLLGGVAAGQSQSAEFQPAASLATVQRQHRRLPTDDIWWTVNGPDMAWNFKNLHQLFPTVNVYRNGPVAELAHAPMAKIADYPIDTPEGTLPFADFIASDQSTALGLVILHRGKIAFERYPRMQPYEMPVIWSVAKVLPATVIRIMEERGEIDVSRPVEAYLPEVGNSSLAGASVRDILDMATGLDCADDYEDRSSCYYRYAMAIGDGWRTADAPDNPYDFVASLKASRHAPPGERFSYSGLNTFVLAWLVEKLAGMPFQDALSREIWFHIGAESNASYIAPRYGVAVTHGGFMARLRDLARFGLLFTPSHRTVSDTRIVSEAQVAFLLEEGNPKLLANAGAVTPGVKHNIYQWDAVFADGTLLKGGWAGQGLIVNPLWDVVAVFTGYFKDDESSEVALQPKLLEVLRGVFGESLPDRSAPGPMN